MGRTHINPIKYSLFLAKIAATKPVTKDIMGKIIVIFKNNIFCDNKKNCFSLKAPLENLLKGSMSKLIKTKVIIAIIRNNVITPNKIAKIFLIFAPNF